MRGNPQFSFRISIALVMICFSRIFSEPRKNIFELVGTVLNRLKFGKTSRKTYSLQVCKEVDSEKFILMALKNISSSSNKVLHFFICSWNIIQYIISQWDLKYSIVIIVE